MFVRSLSLVVFFSCGLSVTCAQDRLVDALLPSSKTGRASYSLTDSTAVEPPVVQPSLVGQATPVEQLFASSSRTINPAQIESPVLDPYRSGQPGTRPRSFDSMARDSIHRGHPQFNETQDGFDPHGYLPQSCADSSASMMNGCDQPIPRFRNGFLQAVQVQYGTLGGGNPDTISMYHAVTSVSVAVPLGSTDNVLVVTPNFRVDFLSAPATIDVPEALYETGVKFFWQRPINETMGRMVLLAPSIRSDFETSENAFRIFGMAMLTWQTIPNELTLSAGVVYLDRADIVALPALGLLWTPTPRWRFDIQFPQPRISYRVAKNGMESESWAYLSGGFGGNTWAATRAGGIADELTISDLRAAVGFERIFAGNKGWFAEAGLAFARQYEYLGLNVENELDAVTFLRGGITF